MAWTRRGLGVAAVLAVIVVGGVVAGAIALGGKGGAPSSSASGDNGQTGHGGSLPPPPAKCPLTGLDPSGQVPNRPALAIKVENLPVARPQTGLSFADLIYEEPVEAGITRFIVVYQCRDASKVEPVRSGRLSDPPILKQFGRPLFGYAGGVAQVISAVRRAGIIDVNFINAPKAYHRDPNRPAPHNLYTSTQELYHSAKWKPVAPKPLFLYSTDVPKGKRTAEAHVPFSSFSDVFWKWDSAKGVWLRFHGTVPHTYSDGTQVNAKNVVIQMVKVTLTDITDVNGVRSPEVVSTGSGKAYVLRNGKRIAGTWSRASESGTTTFVDRKGVQIQLDPGTTWIELVPDTIHVSFA